MTNGDRRDGDDKGDGKPDGGSNEGDKNDADDSGLRVRKLRPAAVEALIGEMKILDASLGDLFTRVCDAKLGAARQDVAGAVAEIKELATSVGEVVDVEGRVKGVDAMRVKLGALIDASGTVTGKREAPTELGGVGRAADGGWVLFRQLLDRLKLSSWALKAFLNQRSTWPNGAVVGMLMLLTALFVVFLTNNVGAARCRAGKLCRVVGAVPGD